jgi:membrane protease subunit (stomatin/prohibitin family)
MAIWDKIKGEFIDIIEWTDSSNDTMVYRFERYGNEIKYGAQLVVRESQVAVFVNMGQLADVFQPGMYELETENIPILSTLQGWKHGFHSPFKAEVYFANTRRFTDLKWGTKNPIMMRDQEFGPVRLRTYGTFGIRINDPVIFIKEIVGTDGQFTTDEITEQLRNIVVSRYSDAVAESNIPVLDLAANYDELGKFVTQKIKGEFSAYGLELTKLLVENVSLPPEVEKAIDKRTSMGVVGNLSQYTQFQAANAMEAAAKNPGGTAAGGIGMGMGFAMANQMGQAMMGDKGQSGGGQSKGGPPPLPGKKYYAAIAGKQAGPFSSGEIEARIQRGEIGPNTLVWMQGMDGWTAANEVPEISGLFGQTPPPLPGE